MERRIIRVLPKVFTGKASFSELPFSDIISKIEDGTRPNLPQGAQELGLTDSLREMILRCLHKDPVQRPNMSEVVGLLRELLMSSISREADLRDFLEICKTRGRDGQGEKAQEFADELDMVRHTERHNICQFLSPQVQTLDNAGLPQEKRKQYLRYLQKLCSAFNLLPSSFLLPKQSVKLAAAAPFDSGGFSTVFKATFNERPIVVKVINVTTQADRAKLHRVNDLDSRTPKGSLTLHL